MTRGAQPQPFPKNRPPLIGGTPILKLRRFSEASGAELFVKAEYRNPGGSIKDRVAWAMVRSAEETGELRPGATLVEATAGNTGIALARIAAARGYRFVAVMTEADRGPKVDVIRATGAEVVLVASGTAWADADGPLGMARRIAAERGGLYVNQFANPVNPNVHERTTALEIRETLGDRIDAVVCGVGSGGTATGIARGLKPALPHLRMIGVTGTGAYLAPGRGVASPYHGDRIAGITPDFEPAVFERGLLERIEAVASPAALGAARCLAEVEKIPAGHSSGACLLAAMREAVRRPGSRILLIAADGRWNYPQLAPPQEPTRSPERRRQDAPSPYNPAQLPTYPILLSSRTA